MAVLEAQQASNLAFFLRDHAGFAPREVKSHSPRKHLSQDYSTFASVESFLWLHIGVQAKYFPRSASRRIAYEYFPTFLSAYEYILRQKLDQKLSPPLRYILESEFSGRVGLFSSQIKDMDMIDDTVIAPFQDCLILANDFTADVSVETLVDSMTFKKLGNCQEDIAELLAISRLAHDDPRFVRVSSALPTTILTIVEYMEAFHQLLINFDTIVPGSYSQQKTAAVLVKERVRDIQRWRLNFEEPFVLDRFEEVVKLALTFLMTSANRGTILEDSETFLTRVRALMVDWGAPPFSLRANA